MGQVERRRRRGHLEDVVADECGDGPGSVEVLPGDDGEVGDDGLGVEGELPEHRPVLHHQLVHLRLEEEAVRRRRPRARGDGQGHHDADGLSLVGEEPCRRGKARGGSGSTGGCRRRGGAAGGADAREPRRRTRPWPARVSLGCAREGKDEARRRGIGG